MGGESSPATRRSFRMDRRSIQLQCPRCLQYSIGREEVIDTAASSASQSGFSPIGISSWLHPAIPNGEMSTLGPRCQAGHVTSLQSICLSVSTARRDPLRKMSGAISNSLLIAPQVVLHVARRIATRYSASFCNGVNNRGAKHDDFRRRVNLASDGRAPTGSSKQAYRRCEARRRRGGWHARDSHPTEGCDQEGISEMNTMIKSIHVLVWQVWH
jgi:hypothetical protein